MRYALFVCAQHPEEADPGRYLAEHLEQVRFVRDNGFDSVFVGQHFLSDPFQMLQPTPLLARLAAESGNLTLGSSIYLAALLPGRASRASGDPTATPIRIDPRASLCR